MQKITPHIWFNKEAKEATVFYVSAFPRSKIINEQKITGTPSGDCDIMTFEILGTRFQAISAGPLFPLNPSISFMVNFDPSQDADARTRIDDVWEKLSEGGKILMPLDTYPFSERYGWVQDKYGVSWQLIYTKPEGDIRPLVLPACMFIGDNSGKAEEASDYYISVFAGAKQEAKRGALMRYPEGSGKELEGLVMFTDFCLGGQWFVAMDSGHRHNFNFNEAVSFIIHCDTQEEINYYSDKLSAIPEAEQCGWIKDRYGMSWQIVPSIMDELMSSGDAEVVARVTQAFLKMKRFDIEVLKAAARG